MPFKDVQTLCTCGLALSGNILIRKRPKNDICSVVLLPFCAQLSLILNADEHSGYVVVAV